MTDDFEKVFGNKKRIMILFVHPQGKRSERFRYVVAD